MSYIVLARKYRPQNFDEVVGQAHITELLKKSIESKRLAHAYLFCGPRGIGKTSCARILAESLNCQNGLTANPCGKCSSCIEIAKGNNFDVIEIDGASNRGIDEIRSLRENVKFAPTYGRYKIYIVDEVHMLTTEAFNALLKTLEEPPEYVKFIFATTEPHKVPATIISRCQKFDFRRVSVSFLSDIVTKISEKENLKIEQEAVFLIAKAALGSVRDALSILDQLSALSDQTIKSSNVSSMFGLVETDLIFELADGIVAKSCAACLETLDKILEQGKDPQHLTRNLIEHFRNLMIIKIGGKSFGRMVDYPVVYKEMLLKQSGKITLKDALKAIDVFVGTQDMARAMDSVRIALEVAFAKLTYKSEGNEFKELASSDVNVESKKNVVIDKIVSKKGHLDFSSNKTTKAKIVEVGDDLEDTDNLDSLKKQDLADKMFLKGENLTLENLKKTWDALTFAVSQEKMSVASYLQEGSPIKVDGLSIVIGFPKTAVFPKEVLEESQNMIFVRNIFEKKLNAEVKLSFQFVDDHIPVEQSPLLSGALDKFQGKVVNQWHRETK